MMISPETKLLLRKLRRNRLAMIGVVLVSVLVLATVLLPWVLPWDPNKMDVRNALQGSSAAHLLGTDQFGRDILTRIVYGGSISLRVGFYVTFASLILGVGLGALSGYVGGMTDVVIMRGMDALMAFPGLLLAIALVAAFGGTMTAIVIALTIVGIPRFARVVRASVLQRKESDYVLAARALGKRPTVILVQDVLPNCIGPILIQTTLKFPTAILGEAGLSFLGLGLPPPAPSWGRMLNEARSFMEVAPAAAIYSGAAIFITVMGFNLLGDGLRDVLDPRTQSARR
ncbi:Glutathione transport system permease protein GsiD [Thalassovita gelatinovora]|uniref:Glutathione transport system permease protein GsiD n=2 Tax=Thalassovita gelatinovora TaxID=53501 RepID=A0A0P1G5F5_THAGE|nr:ABC transporter permease [Thalassovita gelatinovora]QIZ82311.1 ABC transporter permease [Thalassovita gelatinovora]CUH68357.1 Glutathione transport system permease protein GsiD [Thalassovita gelatinovora]SER19396.1 peptide/nickel transport system permease protein [Thalassovita gelatinovora]